MNQKVPKSELTAPSAGDSMDAMPKKLGRRTAKESRATRQALLKAAAEAFAERGLNGAKLDDIARRAGVTKGAVYSHFEDREDLLVKASREAIRSLQLFESASEAPNLLTFFNDTAKALMAPESRDVRMLNVEVHLSATRSENMAELLDDWHSEVIDTLRSRASQSSVSPEATMVIFHILLLGLSHIDAFDSVGADREEVIKIVGQLAGSLVGDT